MKKIYIKFLRDLFASKWLSAAVMLIIACGVGTYSGIEMSIDSLFFTKDKIFETENFADLEVLFMPNDINNLPGFADIPGIESVERRLVFPGEVKLKKKGKLPGRMILLETLVPKVNKLNVVKGLPLKENNFNTVVIEHFLEKEEGFKVGDNIELQVGKKVYNVKIGGIVRSPEYILSSANPDYFLPSLLGVVFGDLNLVSDSLGFTMINDIVFKFKPGVDKVKLKESISSRMSKLNVEAVFTNKDHFSNRFLTMDLNAFKVYTPAIEITICLLVFILVLIIFNRIISEQKKEIGVMLAFGYRKREILACFMFGGFVISFLGVLIGIVVTFIVRNTFANTYSSLLDFPVLYMIFSFKTMAVGITVTLLLALFAVFVSVIGFLRLTPQEIIRGEVSGAGIIRFSVVKNLFMLFSKLPVEIRFGTRNIFRRPGIVAVTIISVGLALAVSISYIAAVGSFRKTIEKNFNGEKWDVVVDFLYPIMLDELKELRQEKEISYSEAFFRRSVEVGKSGAYEGARLFGINPESRFKEIKLTDGGIYKFSKNENEAVLSVDLADKIGLKLGEIFEVRVREGKVFNFKLAGTIAEVTIGQIIIPFEVARKILEFPDECTGLYINSSSDPKKITADLRKYEYTGNITIKQKIVGEFMEMSKQMVKTISIATIMSLAVAIIFIFTIMNLSISDKKGEYVLLKALGYGKKQLAAIIISEALFLTVIANIICIPFTLFVTDFLNLRMEKAWFKVYNYFEIGDFLMVIIPCLLLVPVAVLYGIKKTYDLNIAEVLKTRVIE
ncbi:MAG: hypothetical protein A2452_03630 [Candidatus Firestonebacteria bacterium RIFOXYC2_FULL_39_67]|nr:MAG: hypothetical protein A2536_00455 [Candidatus Firestonebacteria bacterium RIFOXYD2_FULL_39_29]OGF51935.1 MAG: hypothetical protein A2497_07630 [Candidatus Firestonebacteria bacterium RifOxyC12_full_39_7]OGF57093.1 MAG: hypothetical protein A2452_03630 [Candidatus Firestonebacteria bacterium RIFOXYC2_FULL_39_67]